MRIQIHSPGFDILQEYLGGRAQELGPGPGPQQPEEEGGRGQGEGLPAAYQPAGETAGDSEQGPGPAASPQRCGPR